MAQQIVTEMSAHISPKQYSNILNELDSRGLSHPAGRLYHVAFQKGDNMEILAVWDSEQSFDDFSKALLPILESQGITAQKPQVLPVFRILQ